ncbi:unnamed protein product, partial [Didymodactylos carnosus]
MQLLMKTPAQLLTNVKIHEASCEEGGFEYEKPNPTVVKQSKTSVVGSKNEINE